MRPKSLTIKDLLLVNHLAYSFLPTGNIPVQPLIERTSCRRKQPVNFIHFGLVSINLPFQFSDFLLV